MVKSRLYERAQGLDSHTRSTQARAQGLGLRGFGFRMLQVTGLKKCAHAGRAQQLPREQGQHTEKPSWGFGLTWVVDVGL